jgi:hypothetical protein
MDPKAVVAQFLEDIQFDFNAPRRERQLLPLNKILGRGWPKRLYGVKDVKAFVNWLEKEQFRLEKEDIEIALENLDTGKGIDSSLREIAQKYGDDWLTEFFNQKEQAQIRRDIQLMIDNPFGEEGMPYDYDIDQHYPLERFY